MLGWSRCILAGLGCCQCSLQCDASSIAASRFSHRHAPLEDREIAHVSCTQRGPDLGESACPLPLTSDKSERCWPGGPVALSGP